MANYTSQLQKRRTPEKPINTELVGFVLQSKEQAWDANQAKIDETLSQIGSIDLIRDKDKEHLLGNIENLLGNIQNVGKLDLSSDTVSRGLQNAVLSSIDDQTIEQAVNTRNIRRFQSEVSKIKEEDPEKYNDVNYAYALESSGFGEYMSGNTDSLGSLAYTPYVDVAGKVQKGIKDLRDYNKETEVKIPINDGGIARILTKKVKDLNEVELRGYVMSQLGSQERQQLAIDGWGDFRGYSDKEVQEVFTGVFSNKVKDIDSQISIYEEQLKNAAQYQKDDITGRIAILKQEKRNVEEVLTASNANRNVIERVYKEQQLIDDVVRANLDVSTTYSFGEADEAFYKHQKMLLDQYNAETDRIEAEAKGKPASPDASQIVPIPAMAIQEEQIKMEDLLQERQRQTLSNLETVYDTQIAPKVNSPSFDGNQAWNKYKEANQNTGKTERELFQEWAASTGNEITYETPSGETRLFSQDVNEAADSMAQINEIIETTVKENFEANISDVYDEVTSKGAFNFNSFPIINRDGFMSSMSEEVSKYTKEEFKNNKNGIKDKVRTQLYKNKAMTEIITNTMAQVRRNSNEPVAVLAARAYIQRANKWLNLADGTSIEDYFMFTDRDGKPLSVKTILEEDPQTRAYMYPKNKEANAWIDNTIKSTFVADRTVEAEGRLSEIISTNTSETAKQLEQNFYTFSQNALLIRPNKGKGGKELNDVWQRVASVVTGASNTAGVRIKIEDSKEMILQEDPTSPEYIIVSQPYSSTIKGEKVDNLKVGRVLKSVVEQELGFPLNTSKGEQILNNTAINSSSISYINNNTSLGKDKEKAFLGMIDRGEILPSLLVSRSDMIKAIDMPEAYKEDGSLTEAAVLASSVIETPSNIRVKYTPKQKGGYVTIYNTKTGEDIHSIEVKDPTRIKQFRNAVRYAPQTFIGISLSQMVQESNLGVSELFNKYLDATTQK